MNTSCQLHELLLVDCSMQLGIDEDEKYSDSVKADLLFIK